MGIEATIRLVDFVELGFLCLLESWKFPKRPPTAKNVQKIAPERRREGFRAACHRNQEGKAMDSS
ncbi:hypothetical protein [uncultured Slackia sp.]|uniref:hypothetical protein n=1 Tax=uncultured Slackia sp. TaxID=665903 RepID=UPI0026E0B367|nr:hypothetical protein [uncultured Slackia sp.]